MVDYNTPCIYNIHPFSDERGVLRKYALPGFDIKECYIVDNNPRTFRGMHLQNKDNPQGKLVSCIHGWVNDYVLDVRENSPTFMKVFYFCLSSPDEYLYVPIGYAHGYFSPLPSTLLYLMDSLFDPDCYTTINVRSIKSIQLPEDVIISDKDAGAPNMINHIEGGTCW